MKEEQSTNWLKANAIKRYMDGSETDKGTGGGVFGAWIKYSEPIEKSTVTLVIN